jgi:Mycothiol maleylpyruvate isomerase N-terminal domain
MPVIPSAARNDWDAGQQRQRTLQLTNEAERAQRGTSVTEQATDAFAATPMKADLTERTNCAWATLEGTLAGWGKDALTTPGDGWSVKDHVAHIEGWERYLLAILERRSPSTALGIDLATYRSTKDDPINELIREPTREQPLPQVLADLRRTHERLLAVVAALPEGDLERLATHFQPEELADDTDAIAGWIVHICDEHPRERVDWILRLTGNSWP